MNFAPLIEVPLSVGLKWTGGGPWIYEEKKDGVRAMVSGDGCKLRNSSKPLPGPLPRSLAQCVFDGELIGTVYWVFDLLLDDAGEDIRGRPLRERKQALQALSIRFPEWICLIPAGRGGEYLEAVLHDGGEGIVAKHIESRYGEAESWVKCKRIETHDCLVTELHPTKASVRLEQIRGKGRVDCGWVSTYGTGIPRLHLGDVVEIKCHSRHQSGRFREPRIIRIRIDKPASECVSF